MKTDDYSGKQCRDLKTQYQDQALGRVCVEAGDDADTLKAVFEVLDPSYELQSSRFWISTSKDLEQSLKSSPMISIAVARPSLPQPTEGERMEEEVRSFNTELEISHHLSNHPAKACPSCRDQKFQLQATAKVVSDDEPGQSITLYAYEQESTSLMSHLLGDSWIGQSNTEGFLIYLTCNCQTPTGPIDGIRRRL